MHNCNMSTTCTCMQCLEKMCHKGGVEYTNSIPQGVANGWTDRQTEWQILMHFGPDYCHKQVTLKVQVLMGLLTKSRIKLEKPSRSGVDKIFKSFAIKYIFISRRLK